MCTGFAYDTLNVVWGDVRTGSLNIWFQRMTLNGTLLSVNRLASELIPQVAVYPNPVNDMLFIESEDIIQVTLYNLNKIRLIGRQINSNSTLLSIDFSGYPAGEYFLVIGTGSGEIVKKIIKK